MNSDYKIEKVLQLLYLCINVYTFYIYICIYMYYVYVFMYVYVLI